MIADLAFRFWGAVVAAGMTWTGQDFAADMIAAQELSLRGEYASAERVLRRALRTAEGFGPTDPGRAVVLNNLGSVYHRMNKFAQAEHCYRRAIDIEKTNWPLEDERPIQSVVNLAAVYVDSEQYNKAERLNLRALAERLAKSPRNDRARARLLTTLGVLEFAQGHHVKAEESEEQALAIWGKVAPDSAEVIRTLNNLAVICASAGRSAEALARYGRALELAERTLAAEHPLKATLLANMGTLHLTMQGPAAAEPFYQKALAIAENRLGPEHPLVGQILSFYAVVLDRTNRKSEAKSCRRRAQAILQVESRIDPGKQRVDVDDLIKGSQTH